METKLTKPLFKKYFVSKFAEGFLTIKPWYETMKFSIDIGEVSSGSLKSNTLVWVDAIALNVYLQSITNGTAIDLYPANAKEKIPTPESFATYGGSLSKENECVARILKIHYWQTKEGFDSNGFAWRAGAFNGVKQPTGAITPVNTDTPLSQNQIKISRLEMHHIAYKLNLGLCAFVGSHPNWLDIEE